MYSKLVALIHKVLVLLLAWNLAMGWWDIPFDIFFYTCGRSCGNSGITAE